jgi:hypothetical protein
MPSLRSPHALLSLKSNRGLNVRLNYRKVKLAIFSQGAGADVDWQVLQATMPARPEELPVPRQSYKRLI